MAVEPTVAQACADLGFELLTEVAGMVESLARSLREAAARRDLAEVELNIRRLRKAWNAAAQTLDEISGKDRAAP